MGLGFGISISKKPDMRKVFAIISLGMHVLACICYGVAIYGWADAYVLPYFTNQKPGDTWCIPEADVRRYQKDQSLGLVHWCKSVEGQPNTGCVSTISWGYSSFIFWLGFACDVGVVFFQIVESFQVLFGTDKDALVEQKLNSAGIGTGTEITDPLLINADT